MMTIKVAAIRSIVAMAFAGGFSGKFRQLVSNKKHTTAMSAGNAVSKKAMNGGVNSHKPVKGKKYTSQRIRSNRRKAKRAA